MARKLMRVFSGLAYACGFTHNWAVTATTVARGESRNVPRRTTAARRYFFVRMPLHAFNGRALAGARLRAPVPLDAGLSTLPCARPPRLRAGRRVLHPSKEAAMATPSLVLSKSLPYPQDAYLAAVAAGIAAARAWFAQPHQSLATCRDIQRAEYVGHVIDSHEPGLIPFTASVDGFTAGFERGVANIIAGVCHA